LSVNIGKASAEAPTETGVTTEPDTTQFTVEVAQTGDGALPQNADVVDQLAKFAELHANGTLTDEEFAELKRNLIGPSFSKPV
jgi:hypothetical protein